MYLPKWQRTCVATHASGLLLHELLDPLPPFGNGLGLRRVQWQCHADNVRSRQAAERLGYVFEGINRWGHVLAEDKLGAAMPGEGRMFPDKRNGRHNCVLAICWDDWEGENGKRELIDNLMKR